MNNYMIPKPAFPIAAYVLGALVSIGLIGLGIAAYAAFSFIGRTVQAVAFSLIIEAGMIGECLALIRRNWLAAPGLVISLVVSGMYNYTQASQAGAALANPITDLFQLTALSIGPLSAVFFLALSLGLEVRRYESALAAWDAARQVWTDARAANERAEAQEAQNKAAQLELQKEAMRLQSQKELQAAEIAARERAEKRAARIAARADASRTVQDDANVEIIRKSSYADFAQAMRSNGSHAVTAREIAERFGVKQRTAYDWLKKYHSAL